MLITAPGISKNDVNREHIMLTLENNKMSSIGGRKKSNNLASLPPKANQNKARAATEAKSSPFSLKNQKLSNQTSENRNSRNRHQQVTNHHGSKTPDEPLLSQDDVDKLTKQILQSLDCLQNPKQYGQIIISLLGEIGKKIKIDDLNTLSQIVIRLCKGNDESPSKLSQDDEYNTAVDKFIPTNNGYSVNGKPINTGWHIDISKTNGSMTCLSSRSNSNTRLADDDEDDDVDLRIHSRSFNWPNKCIRVTSSHAKYISPHRKRSIEDRMTRAQEAREKILEDRANRFRDILKKVEEMRAWKEEDALHLKESVENKLLKAEAKRRQQLEKIIKKAHDEDSKVNEIQFINNLEAQNRRHEILNRKREQEERIQDLFEERQRRLEEKLAKEAAAEERRKTIEAERRAKLLEIQEKRKIKDLKVEQQQQVKEKERLEMANQKNRDREQKMSAIKAAYQAGVQTLKKKIKQKQEQSKRRHEINLKLIRQKAFELSIKRYNSFVNSQSETQQVDSSLQCGTNIIGSGVNASTRRLQLKPFMTKKLCNICKEFICSESALFTHLRSEQHHFAIKEHYGDALMTTNEAIEIHNLKHIVDTDRLVTGGDSASNSPTRISGSNESYNHNGISIQADERESLLAIEKKSRRLRYKLLLAGKHYNREWLCQSIQEQLIEVDKLLSNTATTINGELPTIKDKANLTVHNVNCHHNKAQYVKINRIVRDLTQMNSGINTGPMPTSVVRNVDRLLVELIKQLTSRKIPTNPIQMMAEPSMGSSLHLVQFEIYAIDTLVQYDIVLCLVSILRKIVPSNDLNFHMPPALPARTYIKMIQLVYALCRDNSDLCYVVFQSNQIVLLSDILSHRLGFIIGNDSPASSISGSSLAGSDVGPDGAITAAQKSDYKISGTASKASVNNSNAKTVSLQQDSRSQQVSGGNVLTMTTNGDDNQLYGTNNHNGAAKRCDSIVDDMTASLCRLLATITDTILDIPLTLFSKLEKDAFHQRCNDFISYMVGVGIVDTESVIMSQIQNGGHCDENNLHKILNFTASCITFVSSLVKALIAKLDTTILVGQQTDRAEWRRQCVHLDSTQLLTTLKMTQISGVLTLIYELLVDSGSLNLKSSSSSINDSSTTHSINHDSHDDDSSGSSSAQQAASGAELHHLHTANGSKLLSYDKLVIICLSLRLINHVAHIDLQLMQSILQDEALSLQLRHVCNYLLWYCLHYQQAQSATTTSTTTAASTSTLTTAPQIHSVDSGTDMLLGTMGTNGMHHVNTLMQIYHADQSITIKQMKDLQQELVDEIILILGNFTQANQSNQFMISSGQRPTIVEQLCAMPFEYFSRNKQKAILMPTLINSCYQNDDNSQLVKQELSLTILSNFIDEQVLASQLSTQTNTNANNKNQYTVCNKNLTNQGLNVKRWLFESRFPKDRWLSAKCYFEQQQQHQQQQQKHNQSSDS